MPQLQTPATFLQQLCSNAANLSRRYCSNLSFLLILFKLILSTLSITFLKYVLLSYFYHSKIHGFRREDASSGSENLYVSCKKIGQYTQYIARNCGLYQKQGKKNCILQPILASCSLQCHPHQLSVKFENFVHSIFRNEDSTLEINVSHFGMLHWQHQQPPTSALVKNITISKRFCLLLKDS